MITSSRFKHERIFQTAFLIRHKYVVKAHATKRDGKLFRKIARARRLCIESIIIITERLDGGEEVEGDRKYRIVDFY